MTGSSFRHNSSEIGTERFFSFFVPENRICPHRTCETLKPSASLHMAA
jgi:hypothetical protein